eukprot:SAG11_NODE_2193_length_3702_cov_6.080242_7_plen_214_part_00
MDADKCLLTTYCQVLVFGWGGLRWRAHRRHAKVVAVAARYAEQQQRAELTRIRNAHGEVAKVDRRIERERKKLLQMTPVSDNTTAQLLAKHTRTVFLLQYGSGCQPAIVATHRLRNRDSCLQEEAAEWWTTVEKREEDKASNRKVQKGRWQTALNKTLWRSGKLAAGQKPTQILYKWQETESPPWEQLGALPASACVRACVRLCAPAYAMFRM